MWSFHLQGLVMLFNWKWYTHWKSALGIFIIVIIIIINMTIIAPDQSSDNIVSKSLSANNSLLGLWERWLPDNVIKCNDGKWSVGGGLGTKNDSKIVTYKVGSCEFRISYLINVTLNLFLSVDRS